MCAEVSSQMCFELLFLRSFRLFAGLNILLICQLKRHMRISWQLTSHQLKPLPVFLLLSHCAQVPILSHQHSTQLQMCTRLLCCIHSLQNKARENDTKWYKSFPPTRIWISHLKNCQVKSKRFVGLWTLLPFSETLRVLRAPSGLLWMVMPFSQRTDWSDWSVGIHIDLLSNITWSRAGKVRSNPPAYYW